MSSARKLRRNNLLAVGLAGIVAGMAGLSFAAVPLYRLFCEVTGYGGATRRAEAPPGRILDREIVVRFDANVSGLPWSFAPEVPQLHVKLGETALVNFVAINDGPTAATGTATFNVEPGITGAYFNKLECFCFAEQRLRPGERVEMPVQFFVSPDLAADPDLAAIRTITLSYTFFPAGGAGQPVAQAGGDAIGKSM